MQQRTTVLLDDDSRRAARELALRFGCSASEAIRRAIVGYRDHCLGVNQESRKTRTAALRELILLFEGHDAQAEIDELKLQDAASAE